MDNHLTVCSICHIVLGLLGLAVGFFILLGAIGVSLIVGLNAPASDAQVAIPIIGIVGFLVSGLTMISPLIGLAAGVGMYKRAQWGRILGIIVSILYLPVHIPFGLLLGVYTLWVLFSSETAVLFDRRVVV